jgi:AcrR family transcriptional regulator
MKFDDMEGARLGPSPVAGLESATVSRRDDTPASAPEESAKRRQILEGARQVFLRDGFEGASMNDVARAAGVSKGTLYVYFQNKVALFEALIREERRQQAERLCVIGTNGGDLRSVLIEFGINLVETITRPTSLAQLRMVIAVVDKFPQLGRAFYQSGPQVGIDRLSAYLTPLVASGALAIDDVEHAAAQLIELMFAGLLKRVTFGVVDALPSSEIADKVARNVDVFLAAYRPRDPIASAVAKTGGL